MSAIAQVERPAEAAASVSAGERGVAASGGREGGFAGLSFTAGLILSLLMAAVFVWMQAGSLRVNFQADGQLPEYLSWWASPETAGSGINGQFNRYLYSYYYPALGGLSRWVGKFAALRLAFGAEILAIAAAVFYFGAVLTRNHWASLLAATAVIWHDATAVAPGGSGGIGLICGPLYPATALALAALAQSWRRRHVWAAFLAGLSFNVHGSSAVFVSAMVLWAAWADGGWRLRRSRVLPAGAACLAATLPTLAWMLWDPPPAAEVALSDWMKMPHWIFPHHIYISAVDRRFWMVCGAFVLPGAAGAALRRRERAGEQSVLVGWLAGAGLLLAIGTVFVEWWPVRVVAQLTLWRGTRYLVLLALVFGLAWLVDGLRRGAGPAVAAGAALTAFIAPFHPELVWLGHLGLAAVFLSAARGRGGGSRGLLLAAFGAALITAGYEAASLPRLGEYLAWRWPAVVLGLALGWAWAGRAASAYRQAAAVAAVWLVTGWLMSVGVLGERFPKEYRRRAAALLDLAPAIQHGSRPGEIVIAPPDLRNPGAWAERGSFLCRQQLTAYAYGPWLTEEILRRVEWYLGGPVGDPPKGERLVPRMSAGYRVRSSEEFRRLYETHGVRLAIVEKEQRLGFAEVAENALFRVYDLARPVGGS